FPAGHRLRVDVASADFQNAWPTAKAATNSVYRGGARASHVILPVAPAQNPKLPAPDMKASPRLPPKPDEFGTAEHKISRDLVNQTVTVYLVKTTTAKNPVTQVESVRDSRSSYTVSEK